MRNDIFSCEITTASAEAEKETAMSLELVAKAEALVAEAERLKAEAAVHAEKAKKHTENAIFYKEMAELLKNEEKPRKTKMLHIKTIVMPKAPMGQCFVLAGMGEIT